MSRRPFKRVLAQYLDSGDERLIAEYTLPTIQVRTLRRMFDTGDDVDLVGAYMIEEEQRPYFEGLVGKRFNTKKYAYFLEAVALPDQQTSNGSTKVQGHPLASRRVG